MTKRTREERINYLDWSWPSNYKYIYSHEKVIIITTMSQLQKGACSQKHSVPTLNTNKTKKNDNYIFFSEMYLVGRILNS